MNVTSQAEIMSIDVNVMIDAISWSPCQNFVLLALNSGHGQLVHLPTKVPLPPVPILDWKEYEAAKSGNLSEKALSKSFTGCWIDKEEKDERPYSLLLLAANGKVMAY